jgi:catechol 2,3-dioxygenase-like lactoylglutathione lyase family enzyme
LSGKGGRDMDGLLRRLAALALGLLLALPAFAQALAIRGIVVTVADLDRSVRFYETALGFRKVARRTSSERQGDYAGGVIDARVARATLELGGERIELQQYLSPAGRPQPADSRAVDLGFQHFAVVVGDMERAYARLRRQPFAPISAAPQTIPADNRAAAGIRAFKFRDPDGHPLELLYFPPGKGATKWHAARGEALFLGIDHSAITVADSERSLRFYRDILGLKVAGESLNDGLTQERLDATPGAVVRVTGLRPTGAAGPGLEFLQYLKPAGGRPAVPTRANDIAHVHLVIEVDNLERVARELERAHGEIVPPGIVARHEAEFSRALMVRDPDGHALLLVQR